MNITLKYQEKVHYFIITVQLYNVSAISRDNLGTPVTGEFVTIFECSEDAETSWGIWSACTPVNFET